ncbi:hypothetical protein [Streptomyces rishiriensis]|uniref:Uncharacterized protein n=1 Tax=Streptomyces rishiriensis TaxID=68264 RepID=A0ABU0NHB5_STRRH|nr:hypothetical protein [Streptomyces rishiriensis]MDQ0578471.1 hypothetical protein [Streptomyces rishiriensis]
MPPAGQLKSTAEEIAEARAAEAYWTPERIAAAVPVESGKEEGGDSNGREGGTGGAPSLGKTLRASSAFDNRGVATTGVFLAAATVGGAGPVVVRRIRE